MPKLGRSWLCRYGGLSQIATSAASAPVRSLPFGTTSAPASVVVSAGNQVPFGALSAYPLVPCSLKQSSSQEPLPGMGPEQVGATDVAAQRVQ
jgi:hypothetical protein